MSKHKERGQNRDAGEPLKRYRIRNTLTGEYLNMYRFSESGPGLDAPDSKGVMWKRHFLTLVFRWEGDKSSLRHTYPLASDARRAADLYTAVTGDGDVKIVKG